METNNLPAAYRVRQGLRIKKVLDRTLARGPAVADGRVIPEDGELPIGVGRRLNATVLFLDICGFTDRPASTADEQETLLHMISLLFSELIRIVEDYGGTVEKNTGDGLMAYFTSYENVTAQNRAIAAAMSMIEVSDCKIKPLVESFDLAPFEFRVCLDHGPITVAHVGAARRFRGMVAIGVTANIACKMLKSAGRNQILVGADVVPGLTEERIGWLTLHSDKTGFMTGDGKPYCFYEYTGRWV